MADAAYLILTSDARATTGHFYIDDELLAAHGITDLSRYAPAGVADVDITPDFFVPSLRQLSEPPVTASPAVVLYEQRGAVALITLNRPEVLNAFNQALRLELAAALATRSLGCRGIGSGARGRRPRFQCRGRSQGDGPAPDQRGGSASPARRRIWRRHKDHHGHRQTGDRGVEGLVAGIGCAYMLACDLVVMAEDAYFTLPFHNIGLIPDGGINWLLERQLGARRAFELAVDCERMPAARCRELGLVNRVVPKGAATEVALGVGDAGCQGARRWPSGIPRSCCGRRAESTTLNPCEPRRPHKCNAQQRGLSGRRRGVSGKRPPRFSGR